MPAGTEPPVRPWSRQNCVVPRAALVAGIVDVVVGKARGTEATI